MSVKSHLVLTMFIKLLIVSELISVVFSDNISDTLGNYNKELEDRIKLFFSTINGTFPGFPLERPSSIRDTSSSSSSIRDTSVPTFAVGEDYLLNFNHDLPPIPETPISTYHNGIGEETIIKANRHFDPWSIVWYVGSFGGLVIFFLVVSCSEWCCRRDTVVNNSLNNNRRQRCRLHEDYAQSQQIPETPPPAYHLFAPPPYESVYKDCVVYKDPNHETQQQNHTGVFVVPVHGSNTKSEQMMKSDSTVINMNETSVVVVPR